MTAGMARLWRSDGGRRFVVVLTLVNTILAAVVAGLEVGASQRAEDANQESQRLAVLGSAAIVASVEAIRFESGLMADGMRLISAELAQRTTATELEQVGDRAAAADLRARAEVTAASLERLRQLSAFYADERYAPDSEGGFPDTELYVEDQNAPAVALMARQHAASDEYRLWDGRSSAYVAILSVIALAFFLLGVAQVSERMRPFLGLSASALVVACIGWTVAVTVG